MQQTNMNQLQQITQFQTQLKHMEQLEKDKVQLETDLKQIQIEKQSLTDSTTIQINELQFKLDKANK